MPKNANKDNKLISGTLGLKKDQALSQSIILKRFSRLEALVDISWINLVLLRFRIEMV